MRIWTIYIYFRLLDKLVTKTFNTQIKKEMAVGIVNNIIKVLDPMSARFNEFFAKYSPVATLLNRFHYLALCYLILIRANTTLKKSTDKLTDAFHKKSGQMPPPPEHHEPTHLMFAREDSPSQTVFTRPIPPSPVGEKEEIPPQTTEVSPIPFGWYKNGI